MNVKKFSDAMSELDTKYVDEALNYKKKAKKPRCMKWGALAACLCLVAVTAITAASLWKSQEGTNIGGDEQSSAPNVVIAPGFLTLTAYAASTEENVTAELPQGQKIIMEEGVEVPVNYNWTPTMSSRPGIPLNLSAPEYPNAIFEVSVNGGELLLWEEGKITQIESPFNTGNDTTIYWTSLSQTSKGSNELYIESEAYINIIVREEEHIVGYAVVEIYTNNLDNEAKQNYIYHAKLLKSVSFPKVNENYQEITKEYIETEMQKIRSQNTNLEQDV